MSKPYLAPRLNAIPVAVRNAVWDELCDQFIDFFRSQDAINIIAAKMQIAEKTAQLYWHALKHHWLQPDNSDLVQLGRGKFTWQRAAEHS